MFGPNVTVATAGHPILPELREQVYQYNFPVTIGRNCWIGAGAIILPGVSIGDGSVIGAGAWLPKIFRAESSPWETRAGYWREINERDKIYYFKDRKIEL